MIVGEADIDVRADTSHTESELHAKLNVIAARVGDRVGTVLGKAMGAVIARDLRHTAEEAGDAGNAAGRRYAEGAERSSARVAHSGRLLASVLTDNAGSALRPLQEVIDKVDLIGDAMENTKSRAGGAMLGVGAAVTGVGALLSGLASREEAAAKRLDVAITNAGGAVEDFQSKIDEAVKGGRRFGFSGDETLDALNKLTLGLGSPQKALDALSTAQDIAAARGVKLATAAEEVRQVYAGSPLALRQFGIAAGQVVDTQKALAKAQADSATAAKNVTTAQESYTDKLRVYQDTVHPTLAQQQALWKSHNALIDAQQKSAAAADKLKSATQDATGAMSVGDQQLKLVADRMRGEAAAAADTFGGRLRALGATVEDKAASVGSKIGTLLLTAGPAIAGVGFIIESGLIGKIGQAVLSFAGIGTSAVGAAVAVDGAAATEIAAESAVAGAAERTALAVAAVGPAAGVAAGEVVAASAVMDGALATTTAAATGLRGLLASILGGAAVGGAVLALPAVVATTAALAINGQRTQRQVTENDMQVQTATSIVDLIKVFTARDLQHDKVADKAFHEKVEPLIHAASRETNKEKKQLLDDRAFRALAKIIHDANKPGVGIDPTTGQKIVDATAKAAKAKGVKPQSFDDFLKQMGMDAASAKADAALKELQEKAAARARELGEEVTRHLRAQVDKVRAEVQALNSERDKILNFRESVLSAAQSFTKLSGLIDDPSTSTAGRITHALSDRLLGLQAFAKNLQLLAKRGLDKEVLAELAQGGPQARALSSALVAGTDAQITQLNATEKAARAQQEAIAKIATDTAFGGRPAQVDARLARLNAQLDTLNKQIEAQPALIAKAVDAARKNGAVATKTATRTAVPK